MASLTNPAIAQAGNGLGGKTHILVTTAAVADAAALKVIIDEIGFEGHTVAGVSGTADGAGVMHFAVQSTGTPAITGCSIVTTFED